MDYRHLCPWAHTGYAQRRNEDLGSTSRSAPGVPMMQAAGLRNRDDLAQRRRLHFTWFRRVAIQGQVAAGVVIVVEVIREDAVQVFFIQHDEMVETLAAYGADNPFAVRILPGRAWCDQDFFDAHALDTLREVVAVDAVAITDEKARSRLVGEGVDDLLSRPLGVGIRRDVEVDDLPTWLFRNVRQV